MESYRHGARVVILGAGGHAREVLDVYDACNAAGLGPFEVLGFLDDDRQAGDRVGSLTVLGGIDWLEGHSDVLAICGIGDPAVRRNVVRRAAEQGARFHTIVHPAALLTGRVELGPGCLVTAGCILTNEIQLGSHVHLNLAATVSHDCRIGDYATLAPGVHLAGNVTVEPGVDIGIGASVIQQRRIGAGAIIGAGAVVTEDIPPDAVAVGVPARVVKTRSPGWEEVDGPAS
jgi:sugar O-acyltransferase (sialic acid O-acetyltransferase NeuD family)